MRVRQAAETYNQAFNRLTEKAVNIRSEARDAYRVYRSAYDIANHYQREVLPLRKIISDEMQLRFSSMPSDVFALLTEVRQRIAALRAPSMPSATSGWHSPNCRQPSTAGVAQSQEKETRPSPTAQALGVAGH